MNIFKSEIKKNQLVQIFFPQHFISDIVEKQKYWISPRWSVGSSIIHYFPPSL